MVAIAPQWRIFSCARVAPFGVWRLQTPASSAGDAAFALKTILGGDTVDRAKMCEPKQNLIV